MAINTKQTSLANARDRFKTVVPLVSGGYASMERLPSGKITVFPWDSSVSEWLATRDTSGEGEMHTLAALASKVTGVKVDGLRCLPEGEISMIVMVSRALAFNEQRVIFKPRCPHCGKPQPDASVRVPDDLEVLGQKPSDYPGYEPAFTLPVNTDELVIRPLLVGDVLDLEDRLTDRSDPLMPKDVTELQFRLVSSLVSVGGGKPDNAVEALSYVRSLHPEDTDAWAAKLIAASPSLSSVVKCKCENESCGLPFTHNLNLRRDFFRVSGA